MIISLVYFWKLSLAFNHEYLCEFFTKFKDQWQFWNLLAMWILKLSFIFMINEELTEIFKVKGKAQFPKIYRIYDQDCIFYFSWHIFRISIHLYITQIFSVFYCCLGFSHLPCYNWDFETVCFQYPPPLPLLQYLLQ